MNHELFMRRCFNLAECGLGNVAPNPLVGALLVYNGKIISEGFHHKFGDPHAEVVALDKITDPKILASSVLYVNLEPCAHFGKTPPCTDLIISKNIKRVLFSNFDPNPLVNGEGMKKLKKAGIHVTSGVLEKEGYELNRRFFTFHYLKRPFIILKWAQTSDGFIAPPDCSLKNETITWVSGPASRKLVHKWRTEEAAILVGKKTVEIDNPLLTARDWLGKNPVRIIIDPELSIDKKKNIYDNSALTYIINGSKELNERNITYIKIQKGKTFLKKLMNILFENNLQSIIIEGGTNTLESFIRVGLWDEARVFTSKKYFYDGVKAPQLPSVNSTEFDIDGDQLQIFRNLSAK